MLLFKKNYLYHLYIFFLVLIYFFSEFSTNIASSKNYNILDIKVEENYDINFDKSQVINKAFEDAFKVLIYKLIESKDRLKISNIPLQDKKNLIDNFSISDEQFINNNYIASFNVQFSKRKILNYLNNRDIIPSSPKELEILLIPVLIDTDLNELYYLNQNEFFNKWNLYDKNYYLLNYILPNEDIEDYDIIKKNINNIENYNFREITKKYNLKNEIILIMLKTNSQLRVYSKIKFEKNNLLLNKTLNIVNNNSDNEIKNIILGIKDNYEDKWKSVNKINTSIKIPIRLSISSSNTKLSQELEKTLSSIDLVSRHETEAFNNKEIIYKVTFNGNPNKLLDILNLYNFKVDSSNKVWKIQ